MHTLNIIIRIFEILMLGSIFAFFGCAIRYAFEEAERNRKIEAGRIQNVLHVHQDLENLPLSRIHNYINIHTGFIEQTLDPFPAPGYMKPEGQLLLKADFPALYESIGRKYTSPEVGEDYFRVPDLTARPAITKER